MKKAILAVLVLVSANAAYADGFVCNTTDGDLTIKVYNHAHASEGTRNAAVMVVSDPSVQGGRKTIARFTDVNRTLINAGARYEANVDLRFNDSGRKGELIGGTKLGELDAIILDVDFSYNAPVAAGEELSGSLTLVKRNGKQIDKSVECVRYLKR